MHNLRNSTTTSTSEIASLNVRIDSLEASNRTTLSLLDSKSKAHDDLASELNTQHQKTVELRKQVSELEQALEFERTAISSSKYREEGYKQKVAQLEKNDEWLNRELKTKASEYTKFRKERNQKLAELQRQNEEHATTIQALQRTEANLRRTLDDVSEKADKRSQRIQRMQEEASQKEQAFQVEIDAANRLAKLRENSASTERARAQDLSSQLEDVKRNAASQNGTLTAELETEHSEKRDAEAKVAELEVQVEHLEADLANAHEQDDGLRTPYRGINGFSESSPVQDDSTPRPFSPRLSGIKGILSKTQLYSENQQLKRDLGSLKTAWDDLLRDLELKEPEVEEMRTENLRLESEIADLSSYINAISNERDQAVKSAKKQEGRAEAKNKEGEVLRQQLRDLSSQIKILLMEAHLRDQGYENLDVETQAQLQRLADASTDEHVSGGITDTDKFISTNLVSFRNITELQEQNVKLLKVTREIGERMENEEVLRKQTEEAQNWEDLQSKYERCKDEMRSLVTQSQSYIKERDMFRRMLSHRGPLPASSDTESQFGESVSGVRLPATTGQTGIISSIEGNVYPKDSVDYPKLVKDMQAHFDSYRNESVTDLSTMKAQIDGLSKLNNELRSEAMRSTSQVTLAHERYEMLQANYTMLKSEHAELQKRSQNFYEGAARQDLRVQQAAEDLVEARGLIDSMRNEIANLKAEKEFWKTVEKRITEDNEGLINERSRLTSLNASLQSLVNEREYSENETRRRFQTQVATLEKDLYNSTTSLREEAEEHKRSVSRRDYEHEQSQKRIDDLVSSLGTSREELAKANTAKDHLIRKVDDLTIELRSARERLDVLQSASAASGPFNTGADAATANGIQIPSISQEQQLSVHVSDLQRDLDLTKNELEDVRAQVEQYKAISQASEEELASMNQTQELFQQNFDKILENKNAKIKELEQVTSDASSELAATHSELGDLRNKQDDYNRNIHEHRKQYEMQLAQLKDEHDRHAATAQFFKEDLKTQVGFTQQAQESYENELVKHADAAKALQKVRGELNDTKVELVEARTDAETARLSLTQSEESWTDSRERFEREVNELRAAQLDLKTQNDHLHQQLEMLTNLRKRTTAGEDQGHEVIQIKGFENLQEVITYLRREKEIVEVQLEVTSSEVKRLKQQLDYTQSQLDDARLKLNQQRQADEDSDRSTLDHNRLMETIHDLNTHRESNVTLRAEARQAQATLALRTKEVEDLKARVEPLQVQIVELKAEREAHEGEVNLLKENADRWQQRAQNVLQKYDRIDPAELESLKDQVKSFETNSGQMLSAQQALQGQLDSVSGQLGQAQEQANEQLASQKARLTEQFKARSKALSERIKEKDAALQTAMNERQNFEERLAGLTDLQTRLDSMRSERDAAVEKAAAATPLVDTNAENNGEEGEVDENGSGRSAQAAVHAAHAKLEAAEAKATTELAKASSLESELAASKARIAELDAHVVSAPTSKGSLHLLISLQNQLQATIQASNKELNQLQLSRQTQSDLATDESTLHGLREEIAQAQQAAASASAVNITLAGTSMNDDSKSIADQVTEHAETVRKELERRHDERLKQIEQSFQTRVDAMKAQLTKKLAEGKSQIRQSLSTEHEKTMQNLRDEHARNIQTLNTRHKDEIEELQRHENAKFTQLQATLEEQHEAQGPADTTDQKTARQSPGQSWKPTEQEARAFVQSNEAVKSIVRQNIISQVNKQKEALSARLKEESEKITEEQLTALQEKANIAKEHAVMMEGKKTALQVNMANNKMRIAQFRIDIVQKAAQETPQKPVKEVWDTAKDAKPPQAPPVQQLQQMQRPAAKPADASAQTFGKPTPPSQNIQTVPHTQGRPAQSGSQDAAMTAPTFGQPTPTNQLPHPLSPRLQQQKDGKSTSNQSSTGTGNPFQRPASSGIPQRQPQTNTTQVTAGAGPAPVRGLQSGLPVARGSANRGNPSGRGSGIGRGGPGIDTSRAQEQPQGQSSLNSAGLNAGAKQFVPGNKRARDETHDGQQGADITGKRIRGGGAGS